MAAVTFGSICLFPRTSLQIFAVPIFMHIDIQRGNVSGLNP